jgi:hypothetical protein
MSWWFRGNSFVFAGICSGKLNCKGEQTNVPHIYAIGDVVSGNPELTPVAIMAGKLLAKRLYANGTEGMDYDRIPTTVFTPLEYGCCGLSEEDAIARYGDQLEVYHSNYTPLEWTIVESRPHNKCYVKLLVNKADSNRVVGFHILGPNAGEITQGWACAVKLGATYETFSSTVGIHPTTAEELTTLTYVQDSIFASCRCLLSFGCSRAVVRLIRLHLRIFRLQHYKVQWSFRGQGGLLRLSPLTS